MITAVQVTVTTAATKLIDIPAGFEAAVLNGATAFVLGASPSVTTANGCPVAANAILPAITGGSDGGAVYGIVAAGSATVGVILSRRG